jgi:hypothetical protein
VILVGAHHDRVPATPDADPDPPQGASLAVTPASVDFGAIDPGATTTKYLTLSNRGRAASGSLAFSHGPDPSFSTGLPDPVLPGKP